MSPDGFVEQASESTPGPASESTPGLPPTRHRSSAVQKPLVLAKALGSGWTGARAATATRTRLPLVLFFGSGEEGGFS